MNAKEGIVGESQRAHFKVTRTFSISALQKIPWPSGLERLIVSTPQTSHDATNTVIVPWSLSKVTSRKEADSFVLWCYFQMSITFSVKIIKLEKIENSRTSDLFFVYVLQLKYKKCFSATLLCFKPTCLSVWLIKKVLRSRYEYVHTLSFYISI